MGLSAPCTTERVADAIESSRATTSRTRSANWSRTPKACISMPSAPSSETVVANDIWASAAAEARARMRRRSGAITAPSATRATTTTSVAIGLIVNETAISAATLSRAMSATLNEVTTPLANPAKPPSSSCSRPLGSACCTAHDVCR